MNLFLFLFRLVLYIEQCGQYKTGIKYFPRLSTTWTKNNEINLVVLCILCMESLVQFVPHGIE